MGSGCGEVKGWEKLRREGKKAQEALCTGETEAKEKKFMKKKAESSCEIFVPLVLHGVIRRKSVLTEAPQGHVQTCGLPAYDVAQCWCGG